MLSKKCLTITIIVTSLTACAANIKRGPTEDNFTNLLVCTDYLSASQIVGGSFDIEKVFDNSITYCSTEFEIYVKELLSYTMRKNGWDSLHPSVKPAIEKRVIDQLKSKMLPIYRELDQRWKQEKNNA